MPNLLARFRRGRTKSLSATPVLAPVTPSPLAAASGTPFQAASGISGPTPLQAVNWTEVPALERQIHPDLDSLVANYTPPVIANDPGPASSTSAGLFATPLRPSTRRHSIDGAVPILRPRTDQELHALPELSVPVPFTAQAQPPTRTRRAPTSSSVAGWSTFGRKNNVRPHLSEFGEHGSPAPSQNTSHSHSLPQSRSHSQVNLGTPSTTSQQLEDSVTHSNSGHGHAPTPGSELPSPASGFTFGSQGRVSGRASFAASTPPPLPPLDHPAFLGSPPSQSQSQIQLSQRLMKERQPRPSSSLPSMHSSSRRTRLRKGAKVKAQDIFVSRPASSRRRTRSTGQGTEVDGLPSQLGGHVGREIVFPGDEGVKIKGRPMPAPYLKDSALPDPYGDDGFKFDRAFQNDPRTKRVGLGGSSDDSQLETAFIWPGVPTHSNESSSSTMEPKTVGTLPSFSVTAPTPEGPNVRAAEPESARPNYVESSKDSKITVTGLDPHQGSHSSTTPTPSVTHAPSSFHRQKRAKIMAPSDSAPSHSHSRPGSASGAASPPRVPPRAHSRTASYASSSLPLSALVSPHAPSVARSAGGTAYYMRDPRRPPRLQPTRWALHMGTAADGGSPVHAWLFFIGFVLFPIWWAAGFLRVPHTRRLDAEGGAEKGKGKEKGGEKGQVVLDDPQVEFDARSWRKRCRIMAGVSLVTYVPFIVLVVIFARRH
ncbi:hypothetical protein C8J57DRAFT_1525536 [Mycena rebaudengoi]|nr:hypothetical protein C8J57DRAFT_1525536 [Mycena rebaudengoi]